MSKLIRLIECGLPVEHEEIEALERVLSDGIWEMEDEESARLEKKVNMDVELLVFGGMELDCKRLPWNGDCGVLCEQ
jgi:hypothetical protein